EPTLHCAKPAIGCEASYPDRLLVRAFGPAPRRGGIVVFTTPRRARLGCGAGGCFVQRLNGLPGATGRGGHCAVASEARSFARPTSRRPAATTKRGPGAYRTAATS